MNSTHETSLGWSLFRDELSMPLSVGDIRQRLELKYCACLALGGLNGHPVDADRIVNPQLRSLGAVSRLLRNWSVKDLAEIDGLPALTAEAVLIATMENPVWGEDDGILMRCIERLEYLQDKADGSGKTL